MKNIEALDFFQKMSENTNDPKSVKLANASDFSQMDADFILKHCQPSWDLLDLGSGTGLIVNKIYDKVNSITAVEPFESFTKFVVKSSNVKIVNQTFEEFVVEEKKFDCITIFGTMHYFNEKESIDIYKKFYPALVSGGKIIIKNQFGVEDDVIVEGFSQEQNSNYFAQYRHIEKEVRILSSVGFNDIEVVDIYPPECNRWENTHFFAIVATN